jgi:hypothetical protein
VLVERHLPCDQSCRRRREFRPSIYGKIATATYIITVRDHHVLQLPERPSPLVTLGIWSSAVITLVSGFHYVVYATKLINQN